MSIVLHEKAAVHVVIACQLKLWQLWIVTHFAPLYVNGRLFAEAALGKLFCPVLLIQFSFCMKKRKAFKQSVSNFTIELSRL